MGVAKITSNRMLEMTHMSIDSAMNWYIFVWSYMESYMALLTGDLTATHVKWMSLGI